MENKANDQEIQGVADRTRSEISEGKTSVIPFVDGAKEILGVAPLLPVGLLHHTALQHHINTGKVKKLFKFSDVESLAKFGEEVEMVCKRNGGQDVYKEYRIEVKVKGMLDIKASIEASCNKFRGDVEEIFVYYLIATNLPTFNMCAIRYLDEDIEDDIGVDLVGIDGSGKNVTTVQVKYIGSPKTVLYWNEKRFGNFLAQSLAREDEGGFGVTSKKRTYFFARRGTLDSKVVKKYFTDAGGQYYNEADLEEDYPGIKERPFWNKIQDYINDFVAPVRGVYLELWPHQKQVKEAIRLFLNKVQEERGFVIAPTGSGKTRCIIEAINDSMDHYKKCIVVVASPRIRLSSQIKKDIYEKRAGAICSFYSGDDNLLLTEDDLVNGENHFFDEKGLKEFVLNKDQSVIVTTYHSLTNVDEKELIRLPKCLKELVTFQNVIVRLGFRQEPELKIVIIADECHNVARKKRFAKLTTVTKDIVNFDKLIGFTATGMTTDKSCSGGMNHKERWGTELAHIHYRDMFRDGYIVPPVYVASRKLLTVCDPSELVKDTLKYAADICKGKEIPCKALVKCKSIEQADNLYKTFTDDVTFSDWSFYKVFTANTAHSCFNPQGMIKLFKKRSPIKKVLFYVNMISEGIDIPDCTALILLKDTLDKIEVMQAIGRVMRVLPEEQNVPLLKRKKREGYIFLPEENGDGDSSGFDRIREMIAGIKSKGFDSSQDKEEGEQTGNNKNRKNRNVKPCLIEQQEGVEFTKELFDPDELIPLACSEQTEREEEHEDEELEKEMLDNKSVEETYLNNSSEADLI